MKLNRMILISSMIALVACTKTETKEKVVYKDAAPKVAETKPDEVKEESKKEEKKDEEGRVVYAQMNATFKIGRAVELNDDLSNKDEFIAHLNKHIVSVEITNPNSRSFTFSCQNKAKISKDVVSANLDSESLSQSLQIEVPTSGSNETTFTCSVYGDYEELVATQTFTVKKDYYIQQKGEVTTNSVKLASGTNHIGALVLGDGVKLVTEGQHIYIQTKEFLSLNAQIETFSENNLKTEPNMIAHSGGKIKIKAEKSFGNLKVMMRGKEADQTQEIIKEFQNFNVNEIKECPEFTDNIIVKKMSIAEPFVFSDLKIGKKNMTYAFDTASKKGKTGGATGTFLLESQTSSMQVNVEKHPGPGGPGSVNYNLGSVEVEFFSARGIQLLHHPTSVEMNRTVGFEGTTVYVSKCMAVAKIVKENRPRPTYGEKGDIGLEEVSMVQINNTNEEIKF